MSKKAGLSVSSVNKLGFEIVEGESALTYPLQISFLLVKQCSIFVPTKRNDLLDILLGRKIKSPRKSVRGRSRSRSVSCSPVRRAKTNGPGGNTGSLSKKARGKTPRKKSKAPEDDGQPVAGVSADSDMYRVLTD